MSPSQVAYSPPEDVEIDARRNSAARRARIIAAHGGCCAYPGCEVSSELEVDHIIALALGGKDRDDNMEPLCAEHHRQKTARDLGLIAKAKRRALKHKGQFPAAKQKIRGRGFDRRWEP